MPEKKPKELAPAGTHRAVLYKVINLGTIPTEYAGVTTNRHKIRLYWELSDESITYEVDGKEKSAPFSVGRKFTYSLYEGANLTPIVEGMIGTKLTEEEANTFDIEQLLGMPCLITIIHDEYQNTKYAKVTGATVLPKSMEKPEQVNESVVQDVRKMSQEEIGNLPEFIRNDMESSDEYHVRFLAPRANGETTEITKEDIPF